jgi:hypothetical protein
MHITLTDLTYPYGQLDLFEANNREEQLMGAVDTIRNRYGMNAIGFWGIPKQ